MTCDLVLIVEDRVQVLEILDMGVPGPAGPAAGQYTHTQSSDSDTWTVNHNFGYYPSSVRVLSPGGIEILASATDTSVNQLIVQFSVPRSGKVIVT